MTEEMTVSEAYSVLNSCLAGNQLHKAFIVIKEDNERLLDKVRSFERSFAGHVYVENEKYSALARHHKYLQEAYCLLRDCREAIDVADEYTWTECYRVRDRIEEFVAKIGTNHDRETKV
jgi:hypothetical protein